MAASPATPEPAHPLLCRNYAIFTPPIAEFGAALQRWAADRLPGALVTGHTRTGKTTAIMHWAAMLLRESEGPSLPVLTLNALDRRASPGLFWAQCLRSTALAPWKSGTALHRFDRLVCALCRRALDHSSPYLVLLIDEANNLGAQHWQGLKNLQNELNANGTSLTVISVGTHELGFAHKTLTLAGEAHLTARFMVQHLPFRGLRDVGELRFVLQSYDEHSRWPVPDGPTYTQYFAPAAFANGFRLAEAAPVMWQALTERLPASPVEGQLEIPMAFVGMLVEHVLRHAGQGEPGRLLARRALDEALRARNFVQHMQVVQQQASYRKARQLSAT